ncbi:MAG: hypothetical protein PUB52_11585 [Lachnospiraceae bacterium]|nr:hypothetical protein [Lachnospiraceae bacterium]
MKATISGCKRLGSHTVDTECIVQKSYGDGMMIVAVDASKETDPKDVEDMAVSIINVWEQNSVLTRERLTECLEKALGISRKLSVTILILDGKSIGIADAGNNRLYEISEGRIIREARETILCRKYIPRQDEALILATEGFWKYVEEQDILIDFSKSETAQAWISYLSTRIGLRMETFDDSYSAIAVVFE